MSTKQVLVRQLSEADAEAYRSLRLHLLQVSPDAYGSLYAEEIKRPVSHTAERLRAQSDPGIGFTLGAFAPDLVGMVTVLREQGAKTRHKASVFAMGVAEQERGRGIGRALVAEAIVRARRLDGPEQLLLTVVLPNEPARRLYHALGFVTYGIDERGLKLGAHYWDEEQMVLHL
ncbi:MAG TPA: GNAT family N-acetyltransferase [Thermomicrobiales bacterium]|jgi:ribosomal protein S18 acetylase RimI-like enzyme